MTSLDSGPELARATNAALTKVVIALLDRQDPDGTWPADYSGPTFLLPLFVTLKEVSGADLSDQDREGMVRHLRGTINPDGSIGLYRGGPGTLLGSVLGYVSLRLLGGEPNEPELHALRDWIERHGGPLAAGPWAKQVLAILGIYEWSGAPVALPELWYLPRSFPVHPGRLYCHLRQVYLPMCWLAGSRATVDVTPRILQVRTELYGGRFEKVRWKRYRSRTGPTDEFVPLSRLARAAAGISTVADRLMPAFLRRRALARIKGEIDYEASATNGIGIGPVNGALNAIVAQFADPAGAEARSEPEALREYLWWDEDGLRVKGYNSSALWDACFAHDAISSASSLIDVDVALALKRAAGFVLENQLLDELPDAAAHWRHPRLGGFPFSTRTQGWPVSDCTAEALRLLVRSDHVSSPGADERQRLAVDFILSLQNSDGGWATYEPIRAPAWVERLNPTVVFSDAMVERSYVECTAACVRALVDVQESLPQAWRPKVDAAIAAGVRFLSGSQRPDGSFRGSWGVCFTYGTWFGVEGLRAGGVRSDDARVQRSCSFLLRHQAIDGSWGEDPASCVDDRYISSEQGRVVMTSWALLALISGGRADDPAVERGVRFLLEQQRPDGSYDREGYAGVFCKTTMINYDLYRYYFPILALSSWLHTRAVVSANAG